jgi:hypothetical protein
VLRNKKGAVAATTYTHLFITLKKKEVIMVEIKKNLTDLKNLIPSELMSIYQIDITSIKVNLEEKGILSPIVLSKDGIPIDGYRRLLAAIELKLEEVPVIQTELEASKENRITLNQYREKTWMDKRSDYLISFETFALKQGKRDPLVKYDRYDEIRKRTGSIYKDAKTLRDVEWILNKDADNFVMSWWLLEKRCDVASIRELMELGNKEKYKSIIDDVLEKKLSPNAAMKEIRLMIDLSNSKSKSFSFPESKGFQVEIHNGEKEDLLVKIKNDEIKALFYEPEQYKTIVPNPDTPDEGYSIGQSIETWSNKIALHVKPFVDQRMSENGSLFLFSHEHYNNGFAQNLPFALINSIQKEMGLVYKQTIYIADAPTFNSAVPNKKLNDKVTHLLWFVKKKYKEVFNNPEFILNKADLKNVDETSYAYKVCTNFVDSQTFVDLVSKSNQPDLIKPDKGDNSKISIKNAAALLPIRMSTNTGDLIVDLSMQHDIGSIATLMNRRYIGFSASKKAFAQQRIKIASAITARVTKPVSVKVPEIGNIGVGKTTKVASPKVTNRAKKLV